MQREKQKLELERDLQEANSQDTDSSFDSSGTEQSIFSNKSRSTCRSKKRAKGHTLLRKTSRDKSPRASHGPANPGGRNLCDYFTDNQEKRPNTGKHPAGTTNTRVPAYNHDFDVSSMIKEPSRSLVNQVSSTNVSPDSGVMERLLHIKVMERRELKFNWDPLKYLSFRNEFSLVMSRFLNDPHYLITSSLPRSLVTL